MFKFLSSRIKHRIGKFSSVKRKYQDINPEDIFLDSANLPGFEEHALEGRIEKPMTHETFSFLKITLGLLIVLLISKLWFLGIKDGPVYAQISENNRLEQTLIFANRGAILDRRGMPLAENDIKSADSDFAGRHYADIPGLSHLVGYIKYPLVDKAGNYYEKEYRAKDGAELVYDQVLKGKNGTKLVETDVRGEVTSESVVDKPVDGSSITLSVDAKLTEALYKAIKNLAETSHFVGGAGVIMNVENGEILALTSFPEYDQNAMTKGIDQKTFTSLLNDKGTPFLNRIVGGLYTPGSIVKPVIAMAALNERIISPNKEILSTGAITVPNPYDSSKSSIFKDWKAHGWTNMAEALAVSSDTYFYSIGGGYGDQKGLGITLLDKYFEQFGLKDQTGIELFGELKGVIPTPQWKKEKFNGDIWRLGDTYITSIGQYGTQVTPINVVRYIAAIANKGKLLKPTILLGEERNPVVKTLNFKEDDWKIVQEGMRESVTYGTSAGLNVPYVEAAGKTGTAEIGSGKSYVHSWSVGFF
ncbi:MAG: penicillin-binding transpeptidase domain-containing protein, partial [Patescibacteria group bacterium]